jgi:hypothetical protein
MVRDPNGESALDLAAKRLERAISLLEHRLVDQRGAAPASAANTDSARLAAELDRSRARERELEAAGAEASAALGRAIVEIRQALNGQAPAGEA